jgi:hypothetical protein
LILKLIDFQKHIQTIINDHFEIIDDAEYLWEFHEELAPHYASYLWTNENPTELTDVQVYLKSLFDLIGPVLEVESLRRKIVRCRARSNTWRASEDLSRQCKSLSHEAYHFAERLKSYLNISKSLCVDEGGRQALDETLATRVRLFKSRNKDALAYRNYLVHGGNKIIDPFRDVTYMELAAITGHPDLWFEFENFFNEAKDCWKIRSKTLLNDMLLGISEVREVNEKLVKTGALVFLRPNNSV